MFDVTKGTVLWIIRYYRNTVYLIMKQMLGPPKDI